MGQYHFPSPGTRSDRPKLRSRTFGVLGPVQGNGEIRSHKSRNLTPITNMKKRKHLNSPDLFSFGSLGTDHVNHKGFTIDNGDNLRPFDPHT